jgi:phage-related protein
VQDLLVEAANVHLTPGSSPFPLCRAARTLNPRWADALTPAARDERSAHPPGTAERSPAVPMHHFWYNPRHDMPSDTGVRPILRVVFYRTDSGKEPVRQWIKALNGKDRQAIGEDIKTAQYGWPLGMPLIRKLEPGLWEVRSHVSVGIARILFTVDEGLMILLHAFIKKTSRTAAADLRTARRRLSDLRRE